MFISSSPTFCALRGFQCIDQARFRPWVHTDRVFVNTLDSDGGRSPPLSTPDLHYPLVESHRGQEWVHERSDGEEDVRTNYPPRRVLQDSLCTTYRLDTGCTDVLWEGRGGGVTLSDGPSRKDQSPTTRPSPGTVSSPFRPTKPSNTSRNYPPTVGADGTRGSGQMY